MKHTIELIDIGQRYKFNENKQEFSSGMAARNYYKNISFIIKKAIVLYVQQIPKKMIRNFLQ